MVKKLLGYFVLGAVTFNYAASSYILAAEALDDGIVPSTNEITIEETKEEVNEKVSGNLEIDVKFVLPISNVSKSNMGIRIIDSSNSVMNISFDEFSETLKTFDFAGESIDVSLRKLNKKGLYPDDEDNTITYIGVTIYGLVRGDYQVSLYGEGYKTSTSNITLSDYSKRISYDEKGMFNAGDVNGDNLINDADVDLMISNFGSSSIIYDLNRDGNVDIADLNYITASMSEVEKSPSIIDTSAILGSSNVKMTALTTDSVSNILVSDGSVKVKPDNENEDISDSNPASISLELENAVQTSELRIETGYDNVPNEMEVTILTEDGDEIVIPKSFAVNSGIQSFTDKANPHTIVIKLNGQVAVKRVTIKVTESSSNKLAEIAKVDFLNNVYEAVPVPIIEKPTHLNVTTGNESMTVTYDNMQNVTGYEILVEEIVNGSVRKSTVYQTTYNEFNIQGLTNYTDYNVSVQSVNQEWRSGYGDPVTVTPKPTRRPPAPDMVVVNPVYAGLNISWKDMKDTLTYNLYYREKGTSEYTSIKDIATNSYQLRNLKVGVTYEVYVTGVNDLGEGSASAVAIGLTKDYTMPNVTNYGLINRPNNSDKTDHIVSVSINSGQYTSNEFALVDNNYETYWQADSWDTGGFNNFKAGPTIKFDDKYKIGHVVLVPKEDNASFSYVKVYYADENGSMVQASASIRSLTSENGQKYYKVQLQSPVVTDTIQICLANYLANGNNAVREMKFYKYDDLLDEVSALFKDDLRVELADNVTEELIKSIEDKANVIEPESQEYNPNRDIILNDLDYARKLMNDEKVQEPILVDTSISSANDGHLGFAMSISDLQPLGISVRAGEKIAVYVGSSNGDMPELVFTQYYAEANVWRVSSTPLKKGQNIIDVPKIGSMDTERGGSVYVRYPKASSNAVIKVRVSGGVKIPVLDLHNVESDEEKRAIISSYVSELSSYVNTLPSFYEDSEYKYDYRTSVLNSTEIVTEEGLFSIPASVALSTINSFSDSEKVERILESTNAFDEMVNMFYRHKGLLDISDNTNKNRKPSSRINIRYMRMFDGAFMYAGGLHVGVGYGSTGGLLTGKTISNPNFSGYFGWGISHEIGHQINQGKLAYAEVTNNVYALLAQTANDTNLSRLESSNIYPKIYDKVTSGTKGKASNVFVSLGMYWQLHLAYDDANTFSDENSIFARINQYSRTSTLTGSKDDLLVKYASDAAGENLITFFEKWGYEISPEAKYYVNEKYPDKNSKAIWYLNDQARRYRINGGTPLSSTTVVNASYGEVDTQNKRITLNFGVSAENDKILGYEIKRNGEVIAFVSGDKTTYTDIIGALNNRAVKYEVTAYDMLLNTTNTVVLDEVKVMHDGSIIKNNFSIESNFVQKDDNYDYENPDMNYDKLSVKNLIDNDNNTSFNGNVRIDSADKSDAYLIIDLNSKVSLSGIRYRASLDSDGNLLGNTITDYEVYVSKDRENWTLAKKGTFSLSNENNHILVYFDKEGTTGGNQLWTYEDTSYVKIVSVGNKTGISGAEIDLIAPPGDNINLTSENIGILQSDYCYTVNEVNEDGTIGGEKTECMKGITYSETGEKIINNIVFQGEYRGNPAFNVVELRDADNDEILYSGEQLLFATLTDDGSVDNVANGTWVFAVKPEEYTKMIGKRVRAVLLRVDNAETLEGERVTSTSLSSDVILEISELDEVVIED